MKIKVDLDTSGFEEFLQKQIEALKPVEAQIVNDVWYVARLEYGSSKQAPHGMVRVSCRTIAEVFAQAMRNALDTEAALGAGKLREGLCDAANTAADFGMGLIRDRTPIRTGRARRGWDVVEAK